MNITNRIPEFKIIFVGDASVGKTSVIMRYQHNLFTSEFQSTVGVAFVTKQVTTSFGAATLNIWDTAGQERYKSLVPMYSRSATAAVIVFDVNDDQSFKSLPQWLEQLKQGLPANCTLFLVGNKIDLQPDYERAEAIEFAEQNHLRIFFVSALTGAGVQELFNDIIQTIPSKKYNATTETIPVEGSNNSSGCC
ncbi:small GTP-binding protein, putative [Trichomonas vaginalis G3]|uniref:Small GTP-binding protein, putative n=1 Tax=Trichomonas vaginalis (strain ATCC PRA-98 / G3) TaxID=412133 RepID=A2EL65_TRIV3|nr:GTPase protein [Trichomonas vaginalis G3]EAY06618.1 small GTP-binding protein, putative [Trichomonas vaginalis G3]KAI5551660.1 GTPase protein [Trichomonas vaginalis G3]|eukprot:XP_001318841.1 small GTP-binding protein [Trichomonas vaginalis G3]